MAKRRNSNPDRGTTIPGDMESSMDAGDQNSGGGNASGSPDADSEAADKEKKANANASSGDWKRLFGIEWWPTERRPSDNSTVGQCAVYNLRTAHSI